ncbi:hypothetical protein [Desertivirga arenae]|uniref:hypothetical protein n=1 Tax=Desertivirga arenae TaxID=2810309 RepID=UPI001A957120|nr:hypothetical protein [Pedobacter sp. SYSU D00823]
MKNVTTIHSDYLNIYVTAGVRSKLAGRILLGITVFIGFVLFCYLVIYLDFREMGKASIPIILVPGAFLFFLSKYLLWNFYGQEYLVLNSKTITYYYDYGFFRTNPTTIHYNRLGLRYSITDTFEDESFGRLSFINYNTETNLPEGIYETAVEISENHAAEIERLLEKIMFDEFNEERGFTFLEN